MFFALGLYLHTVTETKLIVDTSRGETLRINVVVVDYCFLPLDHYLKSNVSFLQFDMTFPALACSILSVDAMDISGEFHLDVVSLNPHFFF